MHIYGYNYAWHKMYTLFNTAQHPGFVFVGLQTSTTSSTDNIALGTKVQPAVQKSCFIRNDLTRMVVADVFLAFVDDMATNQKVN